MSLSASIRKVKAIVLDVDGVMTDGTVGYVGDQTIKFFNVHDGHAIKMAMQAGLIVGFLSGRPDEVTRRRADELGLSFARIGLRDKVAALQEELAETGITPAECLYMGDDLVDLPIMHEVGLSACPANADDEVKARVAWQTERSGGHGAVRELIFRVLKEQGKWEAALSRYLPTGEADG